MKTYTVELYFTNWIFAEAVEFTAPEGLDEDQLWETVCADYEGYRIDNRDVVVGGFKPSYC